MTVLDEVLKEKFLNAHSRTCHLRTFVLTKTTLCLQFAELVAWLCTRLGNFGPILVGENVNCYMLVEILRKCIICDSTG